MSRTTIDAETFSRMFLAGARNLEAKKEWINELNVFPVPDGDTGTNMTLTIMSAASEVEALTDLNMETLAKAISSGSLRGARGNSGVILSQILRGFTKSVKKLETLDAVAVAAAMERGVETAYKAVMKPKEGTILTVARAASDRAAELAEECEDLQEFFEEIFACAQETLERTPDMLPVLKEAGVVDSGGQGLVEALRGALDSFLGREPDYSSCSADREDETAPKREAAPEAPGEEIRFGYCTEFILMPERPMEKEELGKFKEFLNSLGDSIVLVADEEIVKVHVHTNHPGQVFEKAMTYGPLSRMKIDNMREEHQEKLIRDAERIAREQAEAEAARRDAGKESEPLKEYGFMAVSTGEGLKEIFLDLGVDYLIEGGQTMNPSTEDMLNAIGRIHAKTIYIFPNNKNIILAANQARDLTKDKNIVVIPTRTVPQGISAMISFVPEKSVEENIESMTEAMAGVHTGQITYAVRDTRIDDREIHQGDIMGIGDDGILAVGGSRTQVAIDTTAAMVDEDSEIISIYSGADVEDEEAQSLCGTLEKAYPDLEVELNAGGQPIYYYVISVE
ncbi:MAG: DAK2 domain-containing protein [Clostridiales bacterium]|nr:DAK2 domain-containing protein [Clostridiales bacterium]